MQASNVIGHGGFGKVYKGCVDGKEVAIKMVSTAEKGEVRPARVQRAMDTLLAELNIGSRLQQGTEHIVRLFGWSHQADGTVCLVYEYANMGSLTEIPEEMDLPAALRLFTQYAKGLAYMHDRKTLHGDVKPGNLLLHRICDGTWVGRLGDLGLSQIVHTGSQGGLKHTGTRGYLAPELGGHLEGHGRPAPIVVMSMHLVSPWAASSLAWCLRRWLSQHERLAIRYLSQPCAKLLCWM